MRRPRRRLRASAVTALASLGALAAAAGLLLAVLVAPALAGGADATKASVVSTPSAGALTKSPVVIPPGSGDQTHTLGQTTAPPVARPIARPHVVRQPVTRHAVTRHAVARARSAADPAVTIVDFRFGPKATTIHAGDTITWTNTGPSPHSATANNGSFDTGVLSRGQTGSHTFTTPGTYTYFCKVHPFMHGTIVVLASTSPTTAPAPTATAPTPTTAAPTTAAPVKASAPTLPITGMDLVLSAVLGSVLIGLGVGLRRALS